MLDPLLLLARLRADGLSVRLTEDHMVGIKPADRVTDAMRRAIRAHRPGLLMLLAMEQADAELAAMRKRSRKTA